MSESAVASHQLETPQKQLLEQLDPQIPMRVERMAAELRQEVGEHIFESARGQLGDMALEAAGAARRQATRHLLESIAALDRQGSQGEILDTLLGEACGYASRAAFFLTRAEEVRGWASQGFDSLDQRMEGIRFQHQAGSPWETLARAGGIVTLGAAECADLSRQLGADAARSGVLIPFVLRGQLGGALLAEHTSGDRSLELAALQLLTHCAAQALETLPLRTNGPSPTLSLGAEPRPETESIPLWQPPTSESHQAEPARDVEEAVVEDESTQELVAPEAPEESPAVGVAAGLAATGLGAAALGALAGTEPTPAEEVPAPPPVDTPPLNIPEPKSREAVPADLSAPADDQEETEEFEYEEIEPIELATEDAALEEIVLEEDVSLEEDVVLEDVSAPEDAALEDVSLEDVALEDDVVYLEDAHLDDDPQDQEETPAEPVSLSEPEPEFEPDPELELEPDDEGDLDDTADIWALQEEEEQKEEADRLEAAGPEGAAVSATEEVSVTEDFAGPEDDEDPTKITTPATGFEVVDSSAAIPVGQQTVRIDMPSAPPAEVTPPSFEPDAASRPSVEETAELDTSEDPTIMTTSASLGFAPPAPTPAPPPAPPEPPKAEPAGSTEVRPPSDVMGPGSAFGFQPDTEETDEALHEEARRLARLLVSEIKLYNEEVIEEGRRRGDIYDRLKDDIDRSRQMYEERIDSRLKAQEDYFQQELVQRLAGGDPSLLGM